MPVRVMKHNDAGVRVRLEGGPGLFGFVPADYVTDDILPMDPITGQVRLLVLWSRCFLFVLLGLIYDGNFARTDVFFCLSLFFVVAVGMLIFRSMDGVPWFRHFVVVRGQRCGSVFFV